jgi:hypothetical protein
VKVDSENTTRTKPSSRSYQLAELSCEQAFHNVQCVEALENSVNMLDDTHKPNQATTMHGWMHPGRAPIYK